jgi:MSHA biogenesis protein MshI
MLRFLRRLSSSTKSATIGKSVWSAVCLFPGRIDVATIQRGGDKPRVASLESFERSESDVEALKRLGKRFKLNKGQCVTLLPSADYQMIQFEAPAAAADLPLRDAVRERVTELIDQPLAHVTYDAAMIPTLEFSPGRPQNAYAVVAGNAVIGPRVQLFHQAKVALKAIDVPEMAQRNIAALAEQPNRALAFLAFEQSDGLLTFTCNGELYMSRRVEIGLKQLIGAEPDRRTALFDRIGLEVQRSLDNFDRQYGYLPLSRLLLGPQAEAEPLQTFLADYLGIKVDVLDLAEVLDFPDVPELKRNDRQAQCLLTLGAALRTDDATVGAVA